MSKSVFEGPEIWATIPGWPYEISQFGRVRDADTHEIRRKYRINGSWCVHLWNPATGKRTTRTIMSLGRNIWYVDFDKRASWRPYANLTENEIILKEALYAFGQDVSYAIDICRAVTRREQRKVSGRKAAITAREPQEELLNEVRALTVQGYSQRQIGERVGRSRGWVSVTQRRLREQAQD